MKNFFKRYEKKYLIDQVQYELLMHFIQGKITEDKRADYTISNLYYDTDNYDLIRESIEKPAYKEKLRLRTYDGPGVNTPAYIELKKKLDGIVYKRRLKTTMMDGIAFLGGGLSPIVNPAEIHTVQEVTHFLSTHDVTPKALISYDRKAYKGISDSDFRMTFDSNIMYKNMDSQIGSESMERPVIETDKMIMEIKTTTSIPIEISKILSELEIFPTSFSKYGVAYKTYVGHQLFNEKIDLEVGLSA